MTDQNALYSLVKPDIEAVSLPLFDASKNFVSKRGDFLPHAAVLSSDNIVTLMMAAPENDLTNATEVLPLLHSSLRQSEKETELRAIGVCEA
jgi:hypothetical protein